MKKLISLFLAACLAALPITAYAADGVDQAQVNEIKQATVYGEVSTAKVNEYSSGETFTVEIPRLGIVRSWEMSSLDPNLELISRDKTAKIETFKFLAKKPGETSIVFTHANLPGFPIKFNFKIKPIDHGDVRYGETATFQEGQTFKVKMLRYSTNSWVSSKISSDSVVLVGSESSGSYDIFTFKAAKAGEAALTFSYPPNDSQNIMFNIKVTAAPVEGLKDFGDLKLGETKTITVDDTFKVRIPRRAAIDWSSRSDYNPLLKISNTSFEGDFAVYTFTALKAGTDNVRIEFKAKYYDFKVVINAKAVTPPIGGDCKPGQNTTFPHGKNFVIKLPHTSTVIWDAPRIRNGNVVLVSTARNGDYDIFTFRTANAGSVTIIFTTRTSPRQTLEFPIVVQAAKVEITGDCRENTVNYFNLNDTFVIWLTRINNKSWNVNKVSTSNVTFSKKQTQKGVDVFYFKAAKVGKATITFKSSAYPNAVKFDIEVRKLPNVNLAKSSTIAVGQIGTYKLSVNPTAGYSWSISRSDGKVLSYDKKVTTGSGSNKTDEFYFKGLKKGKCTITFRYYQKKGNVSKLIKTTSITVTVK